jgi:hypothetical protein
MPAGASSVIQWAAHGLWPAVEHMSVNHGGFNILVSKQLLHGADIIPGLQQVGDKAVMEGVAAYFFRDTCFLHRCLDGFLQPGFTYMKPYSKRAISR